MKYNSTRGSIKGLSFEEAVCTGFASDGGMLLPESYPTITKDQLKEWAKTPSYRSLVSRIVPLYIGDEIPAQHLEDLLDKAFSTFTSPELIPLQRLKNGLVIAEMFHGQTWSFKDYAMSCVGQFLEYFLSRSKNHLTLLIATSGDTGSAAISAVRGMKWVDVVVFLPRDRCSKLQELQMTTVLEDNVHVYRADGCCDDMDDVFSKIHADTEFVKRYNIGSLNSVNWARIMVQIVHYFYIYLKMEPDCEKEVEIVVPTGGCGNITAGCIARKMGLPIKLVCAVNENDCVDKIVKEGSFVTKPTISTIAPSMDIQMPYNMERIWSVATNGNGNLINQLMTDLNQTSNIQLPGTLQNQVRSYIGSFSVKEADIKATIKRCYNENDYILCPHTAVAVTYHYKQQSIGENSNMARVVVATASPRKFSEALQESGVPFKSDKSVAELQAAPTRYTDLEKNEDWLQALREKILEIAERQKTVD
ncbi:threonine synthase-like 2 [Patella vulgata]|uniref:threonine synthase-like 2 n=1 Tax=Patella vulgata TaxID=6465 RepID=UPI00217FD022|nr:threonine synthase-like 2 [Patella vulgata]